MRYDMIVNGLPVTAKYPDEAVRDVLLPLVERLSTLHEQSGRRVVAFLAAPPATGKSTLAAFLEHLATVTPGTARLQAIGMDGFHLRQDFLDAHTMVRDGHEVPMAHLKGAHETFDLPLLRAAIESVVAGDDCPWPAYDRTIHDPIDGALRVTAPVVLLEGNYLLADLPGWCDLRDLADYTISLTAPMELLYDRLVSRKASSGIDRAEAEAFVERSDLYNARLVLETLLPADLELRVAKDGSFRAP